jgi:hypothetical protein
MNQYFQNIPFLLLVVSFIGCGLPQAIVADTCNHADNVSTCIQYGEAATDSVVVSGIICFEQDATATSIPYQTPFPQESSGSNEHVVSERVQTGSATKKFCEGESLARNSQPHLCESRIHAPPNNFFTLLSIHPKCMVLLI